MVKIDKNTDKSQVFFPKNFQPATNRLFLRLISTVRLDETNIEVSDSDSYTDFFVFDLSDVDLADGEYKYVIKDEENTIMSTGLVKYGEWKPENEQYNAETQYIEYGYE